MRIFQRGTESVRSLADLFKDRSDRLDVLVNNAGLASPKRQLTEDGIESNFALNVVAPFLLTRCLMDALQAGPAGRVINLTGGDVPARLDMDNLQAELSFDGLNSYSQSKLAMMVVMSEFSRRIQGVTINVCYPGQASTNMTRSVTADMLPGFMRLIFPIFKWMVREDGGRSVGKAARSSVYLASSPEVEGLNGKYFDAHSKEAGWPAPVLDESTRRRLWEIVKRVADSA